MPPSTGYAVATASNPASALTDFTLMVDLSTMPALWWSTVDTTDGTKGRTFKDDGVTELAVDWIDFDDTAETGWARIKWSGSLASTGTQKVRIYPPVAANASVAQGDTYGQHNAYASHWAAYWTFDGGDLTDRTSNNVDLTNNGATTGATGKVGEAFDFEFSESDYLDSSSVPATAYPVTVMAWMQAESLPSVNGEDGTLIAIYRSGTFEWLITVQIDDSSTPNNAPVCRTRDAGLATATHGSAMSAATWHFVDAHATSSEVAINLDRGTEVTQAHSETPTNINLTEVGRNLQGGGREWDGLIDDLQVHSVELADAWRDHEHDQTNSQSTFWGTWTWVAAGGIVNLLEGKLARPRRVA